MAGSSAAVLAAPCTAAAAAGAPSRFRARFASAGGKSPGLRLRGAGGNSPGFEEPPSVHPLPEKWDGKLEHRLTEKHLSCQSITHLL